MKEFKLSGWPDLTSPYQSTPYRRMLNDMSQRYQTVRQLAAASGVSGSEVRGFLGMLSERGLVNAREVESRSRFALFARFADWLRGRSHPTPR